MIKTVFEYAVNGQQFQGFVAFDERLTNKRPVVLVAPDWSGCNNFAKEKAILLAQLGYIGFAIDLYGEGKIGETVEQKTALMSPLMVNRPLIKARMLGALAAARSLPEADETRIAAIGFCFGGLCALDLARSGADIRAVVSFHGLLNKPDLSENHKINARVLALHGYDDPMVPKAVMIEFCDEMTEKDVAWQLVSYGKTQHAFTNPLANDHLMGTVYQPEVAEQAWMSMQQFLSLAFL